MPQRLSRPRPLRFGLLGVVIGLLCQNPLAAQAPLHQRIDRAVEAGFAGKTAAPATDADFLRRVYLDLAGTIPTAAEARQFLADQAPNRRARLVDRLLAGPDYPRRLQQFVHVLLQERRDGKDVPMPAWEDYLVASFAANKPWDQLAREILAADPSDAQTRPAAKFYLDRGADQHLITRDVARLFLGKDLECARCHDHPVVKDYKQADYYGLYAFFSRSQVARKGKGGEAVFAEKAVGAKVDFESVFLPGKKMTGPRLPGGKELDEPAFPKGQEFAVPPKDGLPGVPRFSPRAVLARELTAPTNKEFARNAANRLWFLMTGRGVVHPLELHHSANPPSNPELLDVLTDGLTALKFDVKAFLREVALSRTYQRSSLLPDGKEEPPEGSFAVALLRPLSPEQMFLSIGRATGELDLVLQAAEAKQKAADPKKYEALRNDPAWRTRLLRDTLGPAARTVVSTFGSPPGQAEVEFQPSLAGALYLSNNKLLQSWLTARPGNLIDRLQQLTDAGAVAEELYLSVLTRLPTAEERAEVADHLRRRSGRRPAALQELAWALIASTEFRLNH